MHRILTRQLKKYFGNIDEIPKAWEPFLEAVSDTYGHWDEDRALRDRSLELTSRDLNEINQQLRAEIAIAKQRTDELERLNDLMVGRELRMAELKERIATLSAELARFTSGAPPQRKPGNAPRQPAAGR